MESLLDCEVCMEKYTEIKRRPRSLPCGHSMCHSCLKDLLKANKGYLECPFCRRKCCSKPKTAENFPATFAILRMLEPEQQSSANETNTEASAPPPDSFGEKRQTQLAITESYVMSCKDKISYLDQHRAELESQRKLMQQQVDDYMRDVERRNSAIKELSSQIEEELSVLNEVMNEGIDIKVTLEEFKLKLSLNEKIEEVEEQQLYSSSQGWNLTVATLLDNSNSLDNIEKLIDNLSSAQWTFARDEGKISSKLEKGLKLNENNTINLSAYPTVAAQCALINENITSIPNKPEIELKNDEKTTSMLLSDMERNLQVDANISMPEVFIPLQLLDNLISSPSLAKITRLTLHLEVEPMSSLPDLPEGAFSHISLFILGLHAKLEDQQADWCGRFIGHLLAGRGGRCNRLVLNGTHITGSGGSEVINSLSSSGVCITECFKIASSCGLYDSQETELRKMAKSKILDGWDFKWKMSDKTKFYVSL